MASGGLASPASFSLAYADELRREILTLKFVHFPSTDTSKTRMKAILESKLVKAKHKIRGSRRSDNGIPISCARINCCKRWIMWTPFTRTLRSPAQNQSGVFSQAVLPVWRRRLVHAQATHSTGCPCCRACVRVATQVLRRGTHRVWQNRISRGRPRLQCPHKAVDNTSRGGLDKVVPFERVSRPVVELHAADLPRGVQIHEELVVARDDRQPRCLIPAVPICEQQQMSTSAHPACTRNLGSRTRRGDEQPSAR